MKRTGFAPVREGNRILVAGTGPVEDDGVDCRRRRGAGRTVFRASSKPSSNWVEACRMSCARMPRIDPADQTRSARCCALLRRCPPQPWRRRLAADRNGKLIEVEAIIQS